MKIISIDYQFDFADPAGRWYQSRPSHDFIPTILTPWLREKGIKIAEVVSDYRLPRPSEREGYCIPGTPGYESLIPSDLVAGERWIKSMNSPAWRRKNGGESGKPPGVPYPDPDGLSGWLESKIGSPGDGEVVLIGLTLDCCVLCMAQELYFRGHKTRYLYEGVDTYSGLQSEKDAMAHTPLPMWGSMISWNELTERGVVSVA